MKQERNAIIRDEYLKINNHHNKIKNSKIILKINKNPIFQLHMY